ncbi:hypothetical protein F4775DRAFT_289491 [Biscogniauxia sp. FL1348]|nr:hypothetical protein F4775DRAFT_289491 [Biscogniauxia sp. FL1348]
MASPGGSQPNADLEGQNQDRNERIPFSERARRGCINMLHKIAKNNDKTGENYSYINPRLKANTYDLGDMYDDKKLTKSRTEWQEKSLKPYQGHVKCLSEEWPHLRLLLDFMEVGTSPMRWKKDPSEEEPTIEGESRSKRQEKTKAYIIQYDATNSPTVGAEICKSKELLERLETSSDSSVTLRLVVVEDLSRDVIETLGTYLKIEPEFFRAHILDYAWYNVRDFWRNPPNLNVITRHQRWFQLRFARARYFESGEGFKKAFDEKQKCNVARRPDDDRSNTSLWDDHNAKVGLTRSKVSFWMKPKTEQEPAVGVLLLDPTNTEGFPLWRGYRNWTETPEIGSKEDQRKDNDTPRNSREDQREDNNKPRKTPQQSTLFEDFIYWTCRPEVFLSNDQGGQSSAFKLPIAVLLHLVCAEWQTIADYVKTRLNQIDWEIAQPGEFIIPSSLSRNTSLQQTPIDQTLLKLHVWRRFVPLYREMLSETLIQIFQARPSTSITAVHSKNSNASPSLAPPRPSSYLALINNDPTVSAYRTDFELILSYMEEFQQRIDRLTHVATAAISIQDSRRGIRDNTNIQYLTYLATFFIPMSLVAALLSMQPDVSGLGGTLRIWAEASLPAAFLIMLVIGLSSYHGVVKGFS